MAVLALGFVGTAIGGSIGGTVLGVAASSIGGFLGSQVGGLLDNMLFGGTKVQGPRLEDKRVQVSTYGAAIPRVWGPENRLAGLVFWSTGLIETENTDSQGGKGGPSVETTTYSYAVSFALLLAEGRTYQGVKRVYANNKLIYDRDGTGSPPVTQTLFDSLTFYPGNGTQNPDPVIESYLGAGNAPAYRHSCYIVIENLQLADFGNRLPNIEVELEADTEIALSEVVQDICVKCGVDPNEISTGSLRDVNVRGFAITSSARGIDGLQPLALAYSFDVAEQGGNMRFITRGLAPRGTLELGELGAFEGGLDGTEPPEPIRFDLLPVVGLPREAVVSFSDPDRDYQRNAQPSRRQFGDAESNLSYDLPLTLDVNSGRQIADRMLYEAWIARRTIGTSSNDRARHMRAGDVYFVPSPAGLTRVRLTRIMRGANRLYQIESREDDATIYDSNAIGIAAAIPAQVIRPVGVTLAVFMDAPLLRDMDDDTGFYYSVVGLGPGWRGANLKRSSDGGTSYFQVAALGRKSKIGTVATALGDGPVDIWDEVNTLTVVMVRDDLELSSFTEGAVLNGANVAWLGDPDDPANGEVLQFRTATLVAPFTYELSGLLRGRAGTEFATAGHGLAETFVLLEPATLNRSDFGPADWNQTRLYKPVSVLATEADTASQTFTNTGEGKRPLAGVHPKGVRNGSNDLTLTWFRRSRYRQPGLGNGPVPLGEAVEAYEVDILGASPGAVLRTVTSSTPSITYTAADQTADGLTPGDPVAANIYQMSDARGRGHVLAALV